VFCHVRPGVTERDLARSDVRVVPPGVAPTELVGVSGAPVKLDHYAESLV